MYIHTICDSARVRETVTISEAAFDLGKTIIGLSVFPAKALETG